MDASILAKGKHGQPLREQALIDAATAVFAEKGYESATTRGVAERAACSEGLIHRYFGGKRGLLMAALHVKAERMQQLVREGVPDGDDLRDEVRALMFWSLEFSWTQRDFMRVASAQGIIDPEIGRLIGAELSAARVRVIEEKLARHRDAGRIRQGIDLYATAHLIAGLTYQSGFFLQVVFEMPHEKVRGILYENTDVLIRGIASDSYLQGDARER